MAVYSAWSSDPTHRYSFDANANDSVGTAHGTLLGNAVITNGSLVLNGTNGLVQMPVNLFTNSKSLTLETWFVHNLPPGTRFLWSFSGSPRVAFMIHGWDPLNPPYHSIGYYGNQSANSMVNTEEVSFGKLHHLVWTQDEASRIARIYLNGVLCAQNTNFTATPGTTTISSYLGGDGNPIKGTIFEFRTYSNALSHLEVLQSAAAGPDALPGSGNAITNLALRSASHLALNSTTRPLVFADFTQQQEVNITPLDAIVFISSDTNVVNPTTNGYLEAVGLGAAEIVAAYGGLSATTAVVVVTSAQFSLAHRYNFDAVLMNTQAADLAGTATGTLVNGGILTNGQQLYLSGAHVDLPDGIISGLNAVTLEAWVTGFSLNISGNWQRVFDFGSRFNNGTGHSYLFLAPSVANDNFSTNRQFIRFAATRSGIVSESPRLTVQPWMLDGFETHVAVTYDPPRNLSKLYVNGVLADTGPAPYPLSSIVDTNNWLGRSQYSADSYFHGLFNEFRIYRTALEASDVAASYALGPDVIGADYALHAMRTGENLTLSWGPSASWCVLKTSPDCTVSATWNNAGVTPVFVNGRLEVNLPLTDDARYFRLSPP